MKTDVSNKDGSHPLWRIMEPGHGFSMRLRLTTNWLVVGLLVILIFTFCDKKKRAQKPEEALIRATSVVDMISDFGVPADSNLMNFYIFKHNPFTGIYQQIHFFDNGRGDLRAELLDSLNISNHEQYFRLDNGEGLVNLKTTFRRLKNTESTLIKDIRKQIKVLLRSKVSWNSHDVVVGFIYYKHGREQHFQTALESPDEDFREFFLQPKKLLEFLKKLD